MGGKMSRNLATKPKDTFCSACKSEDHIFLHRIWKKRTGYKMCTSCVLQSHRMFYCPTCFAVHDRRASKICIKCDCCPSRSHVSCFPPKESFSGASSMCATCLDPQRLVFTPRKKKPEGRNGSGVVVDMKAAGLLLTAANIVKDSISSALDESESRAWEDVSVAFEEKKLVMKELEKYVEPRPLDSEATKLVGLSIEGEADI